MSDTAIQYFVAIGTTAERVAFTPDPPVVAAGPDPGAYFYDTDLSVLFIWVSGAWAAASGFGTVTHTAGALTANAVVIGNGAADLKALASLGTTVTVLHGNAAGAPTFGPVVLTTDVTGTLPAGNGGTGITSLGTGIPTALGINVGSAGAPVLFNGALGTPSSGTLTSATGLPLTTGVTGTLPAGNLSANVKTAAIIFVIDGAGSAITTGVKGFLQVPFGCTIISNTVLSTDAAATSGSIVIDIWKDTLANYPPTVGDTITASAKPTLSGATNSTDSTLTGWNTAITAGDVLGFKVDSATTVTRVTLQLAVVKT